MEYNEKNSVLLLNMFFMLIIPFIYTYIFTTFMNKLYIFRILIFFNYNNFKYVLIFCGFSFVKVLQPKTRDTELNKFVYPLLITVEPLHRGNRDVSERVI